MTRAISHGYSRRIVRFLGALVCSLSLAACGGAAAPTASPIAPTSGTSISARAGFIATLIPLTEAPTRNMPAASARAVGGSVVPPSATAPVTPAATRSNATPVGTAATGTRTWMDPTNGIQLQYPAVWRATTAMTPDDDDLRLDGPSNQTLFVDIFAPDASGPAPNADAALQMIRDAQARSIQYTYTYGTEQKVKVGGEDAKYLEYQYTPRANQTAPAAQGAIWVIQRGDRTYMLRASNIGMSHPDVDRIIASVSYSAPTTPSAPAPTAAGRTAVVIVPASSTPRTGSSGTPGATAPLVRGTPSSAPARAASSVAGSPIATP